MQKKKKTGMPVYINKFICDHVSRENAANNSRIQSKKKKFLPEENKIYLNQMSK